MGVSLCFLTQIRSVRQRLARPVLYLYSKAGLIENLVGDPERDSDQVTEMKRNLKEQNFMLFPQIW